MERFSGNTEILDAIDLIVANKGIPEKSVVGIVEDAIAGVMKEKYGQDSDVVVKMDRKSGEIEVYRRMLVVDGDPADVSTDMNLSQARRIFPKCNVGDKIDQLLPDISSERRVAGSIKNHIFKEIRSIEKQVEYDEYKKREKQVITGFVKKSTKFSCIVAIGGKAEGIIFKDGMIFGETFHEKERVSACISEVRRSDTDFQIILSRTSDEFLMNLMSEAVPEVSDGLIEIKGIARNPGSRSKVAVWSSDSRIDAVGACIGARGSRISGVVDELKGEKVDIVAWDMDIETFTRNAIVPARPTKIEIGKDAYDKDNVTIVVPEKDLSLAIGKRGQNVRLASKILNMDIDIVSEEVRQASLMAKLKHITAEFIGALDIDEMVAQLLISEGFMSVSSIADAGVDKLGSINGFNEKIASELHVRAVDYRDKLKKEYNRKADAVNFDRTIEDLPYMTDRECMTLISNDILTMRSIADLSVDEFEEVLHNHFLHKSKIVKIVSEAKSIIYS